MKRLTAAFRYLKAMMISASAPITIKNVKQLKTTLYPLSVSNGSLRSNYRWSTIPKLRIVEPESNSRHTIVIAI